MSANPLRGPASTKSLFDYCGAFQRSFPNLPIVAATLHLPSLPPSKFYMEHSIIWPFFPSFWILHQYTLTSSSSSLLDIQNSPFSPPSESPSLLQSLVSATSSGSSPSLPDYPLTDFLVNLNHLWVFGIDYYCLVLPTALTVASPFLHPKFLATTDNDWHHNFYNGPASRDVPPVFTSQ